MKKIRGLRQRWLLNTAAVVCALGLVCVLAVTAVFATYYYSNMQADLYAKAESTNDFFADHLNQNYNQFYRSCITYANTFEDKDHLELQFINADGTLVASSYGAWTEQSPATPEVREAMTVRATRPFVGNDPITGEHIMAVSSPMIYSNGEVIGVLRYVTSLRKADIQIGKVAALSILALIALLAVVLLSSNYYIRSILIPVAEITEKAKRIANGSYGVQIQTHYDDEIGELAKTINEMSIQISHNEKTQTEFISSLSHELRTPLTAITGWSETILGNEDLDLQTRRGMKIIRQEAKRLTEMVVELLDFTKIQDGRMTLDVSVSDIRAAFEDTVYMYGSRLSQDGITLEYLDNDEDIPEIPCDPERMRQVFLNILDNAAKHGGSGKVIKTAIHRDGDDVVMYIRDFGPGIPEDEIPLVKHKFYRGSSSVRGTGIGLAVCDEIVALHNGELIIENADGGGTLVTIRIPISQ